jgi:hypothetical protein
MEAKHTPTPWSLAIRDHHNYTEAGATIFGAGNEAAGVPVIADLPPRTVDGTHEANAKFIVRACNSHEQLVAALDSLLFTVDVACGTAIPSTAFKAARDVARAALAAAGAA